MSVGAMSCLTRILTQWWETGFALEIPKCESGRTLATTLLNG